VKAASTWNFGKLHLHFPISVEFYLGLQFQNHVMLAQRDNRAYLYIDLNTEIDHTNNHLSPKINIGGIPLKLGRNLYSQSI
jgi:hypothetical protein